MNDVARDQAPVLHGARRKVRYSDEVALADGELEVENLRESGDWQDSWEGFRGVTLEKCGTIADAASSAYLLGIKLTPKKSAYLGVGSALQLGGVGRSTPHPHEHLSWLRLVGSGSLKQKILAVAKDKRCAAVIA